MDVSRLVAMANDIAAFFESESDAAAAVEGVRNHLTKFWEPRMRREISNHVRSGGGGPTPIALAAVKQLESLHSPNQ